MDYRQVYYGTEAPEPDPLWARVLAGGSPAEVETTLPALAGRFLVSCYPLADAQGQPWGAVVAVRNVTQQRKLEEQLRQAQKMQAIGQLASGVAHDFNNLLTVISGHSELLLQKLAGRAHPLEESVAAIQDAAERAALLTRQLLLFSRKQMLEPQVLDLNAVLQHTAAMLRRLIGEDITLTTDLAPGLPRIKADPSQIEQVVVNLAVNARDAMPQGGRLSITTGTTRGGEPDDSPFPHGKPGPFVHLAVSDTGCGMTPEVAARIFEPFFTTKAPGRGSGLGLATVYGIVEQSGGFIRVASKVGCGTTFDIFLPAVTTEAPALSLQEPVHPAPGRSETVLLVEDDAKVRQLARMALDLQGYTVREAESGLDALRWVEQHGEPIDLLVTDVVMPAMSGWQLAEQLRSTRPELKVLFMSGYTDERAARHGIPEAMGALLEKPFTLRALARKVRQLLDSGQAAATSGMA
jgi:signal transduction histidine kinase/ActR/RegA family two-component response regulator